MSICALFVKRESKKERKVLVLKGGCVGVRPELNFFSNFSLLFLMNFSPRDKGRFVFVRKTGVVFTRRHRKATLFLMKF